MSIERRRSQMLAMPKLDAHHHADFTHIIRAFGHMIGHDAAQHLGLKNAALK